MDQNSGLTEHRADSDSIEEINLDEYQPAPPPGKKIATAAPRCSC